MKEIKQQITERAKQAIADEVCPGCVVGVVTSSGDQNVLSFGHHTYERKTAVASDTVYDIASITKAAGPHSALLHLIDSGRVGVQDKVVDYLPEFSTSDKKRLVIIKHLLTYTLDIWVPQNKYFSQAPVEKVLENIMEAPLRSPPGSTFLYTKVTTILIARIVEQVVPEKSLDEYVQEVFFDPLGMQETTFHTERLASPSIPPTENKGKRGLVQGAVHDEDTKKLQDNGYYCGAAGLFSTAPDLLRFLQMLLNGGQLYNIEYFSEETLNKAFSVQFSGPDHTVGLGWELADKRHAGYLAGKNTFSFVGFTGCLLAGNRKSGSGVVLLSNRTYPSRPKEPDAINGFRQDISDIVWEYVSA